MKSLGKAKKKIVWCISQPIAAYDQIHGGFGEIIKNKFIKGNKKKTIGKVKCPHCGQKFKPKYQHCGDCSKDGMCWHFYVPAHKKTIKVLKKV